MATTNVEIPGYVVGTWKIKQTDSDVMFTVRHMLSTVIGRFTRFQGEIVTADDPLLSSVTATVDLTSVDITQYSEKHNEEIRSKDVFDVAKYPSMTYRSIRMRSEGDGFLVDGVLNLHGITRPVGLTLRVKHFGPDGAGGARAGFSLMGEINRLDFGLTFNSPMETGGVVLGDNVQLLLDIEAILDRSQ
jgi:polyisoprenoid-binding protein YceI